MNFLLLIYFTFYLTITFSKSIDKSQPYNEINNKYHNLNKKYIIVYKNIIEHGNDHSINDDINHVLNDDQKQNQGNHLKKRTLIRKNLKSKFNLLTFKYKLNHPHEYSEENLFSSSDNVQANDMNSIENPVLTKSFMFVDEMEIIREVYGDIKDRNYMKRSQENDRHTMNEFIKSVNSTEFPIDYIEEDYPVYSDDISDEAYQNLQSQKDNNLIKKSKILNIITETLEEDNYVFGDSIEVQKNNLEWVIINIFSFYHLFNDRKYCSIIITTIIIMLILFNKNN